MQEESVQQVQEQLEGGKQQHLLIQQRLSSGSAASAQQPQPSSIYSNTINSHANSSMLDPHYGNDQAQQNDQDYENDQDGQVIQEEEVDMDFDPPGSAVGPQPEPPFGYPSETGFGQDQEEEEAQTATEQGQDAGQDLYSPGLSMQPSGSHETSFPSEILCMLPRLPVRYSLLPRALMCSACTKLHCHLTHAATEQD